MLPLRNRPDSTTASSAATLARMLAGLWLAAGVSGCALMDRIGGDDGDGGGWGEYFRGDDLRPLCDLGQPDHLRLVYRSGTKLMETLEVLANPAGGALIVHHVIEPADLARGEPTLDWLERGRPLMLSPRDFGAVIYWLDRLGLFTPELGTPSPGPDTLTWLISGCLDGTWLLNSHVPPDSAEATDINLRHRRTQTMPRDRGPS